LSAAHRSTKNAAHQAAVKAWAGIRPDPTRFAAEILPGLRAVPVATTSVAIGTSCSPGRILSVKALGVRPVADSGFDRCLVPGVLRSPELRGPP